MSDGAYIFEIHFRTSMPNGKATSYIEARFNDVRAYFDKTTYRPVLEDDFDYARSGREYRDRSLGDERRVVVRAMFPQSEVDDAFDPEDMKRKLENRFGEHDDFTRVTIEDATTLSF